MVRLSRNEKQTHWLNSKASNATIGFDLGHDLDLEFSRSSMEFPISQPKVVRLPRNENQTHRLNSRPQMWPMGLTFTITLTFEFWRSNVTLTFDHTHDIDHEFLWSNFEIAVTMTIWWPRSGVWIYQIVTGVTSDVGVPSTHLVIFCNAHDYQLSWIIFIITYNSFREASRNIDLHILSVIRWLKTWVQSLIKRNGF